MEPDTCLSCERYSSYLHILEENKTRDLARLRVRRELLEQAVRDNESQQEIHARTWIFKFYLDRLMINAYLEGKLRRLGSYLIRIISDATLWTEDRP